MPPAMTRHPQHDHPLMLWVFNRRGSCCSLFRKPLVTPQPKPGSKRLRSHRRRSQRVRYPQLDCMAATCISHGVQAEQPLFYSPISPSSGRRTQVPFTPQTVPRGPACRHSPARPISTPFPSLPRLSPALSGVGAAWRSVLRAVPKRTAPRQGREVSARVGEEVTWRRGGKARGPGSRPAGGARQPRPSRPPPGACKLVAVGEPRLCSARCRPLPAPQRAPMPRLGGARYVLFPWRPEGSSGAGLCLSSRLAPGLETNNKEPSSPTHQRRRPGGVWGCVRGARRGEARREAGCGLRPRVPRFIPHPPPPGRFSPRRRPRRVCRRESSGASRRPGVSVETGGESGGLTPAGRCSPPGWWGASPLLDPSRRPLSARRGCRGNGRGLWWSWARSSARPQAQVAGLVVVS